MQVILSFLQYWGSQRENARPLKMQDPRQNEDRKHVLLKMQESLVGEARFSEIMSRDTHIVKTEIYFLLCTRLFAQNSFVKENYAMSRHFNLAPG